MVYPETSRIFILNNKKINMANKIDKKTLEKIKNDLLKRKEQILDDLDDTSDKQGDRYRAKMPEYGDKLDDNAQETSEYSTNLATEEVLKKTLRDIDSALENIEKGTYGICKYCKEPISDKRLLARPIASSCIKCKTKLQENQ